MTETGWIKLHRKITEWEWYNDLPVFKLFTHLLLTANREPRRWKGVNVKPGQVITGRTSLAKKTGLTEQQVRTAIEKLKSTNEITIKTTNRNTLISIINWDSYQVSNQNDNQQTTNKQPTNNQQITTNKKEEKEEKEEKVVEGDDQLFFEMFRRAVGQRLTDEQIIQEIGKLKNVYPGKKARECGRLVNAWIAHMDTNTTTTNRMVF